MISIRYKVLLFFCRTNSFSSQPVDIRDNVNLTILSDIGCPKTSLGQVILRIFHLFFTYTCESVFICLGICDVSVDILLLCMYKSLCDLWINIIDDFSDI